MLTQVILLHLVAGCDHTPFMMQGVSKGMQSLLACIPGQWKAASCCIPVMIRSVLLHSCNDAWFAALQSWRMERRMDTIPGECKKGVVAFLYTSYMVTGMQSHPAARYNKNLWINITTLSWPLTFLLSFCVFFGAKFTKAKMSTNHFITIILLDFVQKHFTSMHLEVAALFHNILYKINTSGPKRLCNGYSMTTIKQFFY